MEQQTLDSYIKSSYNPGSLIRSNSFTSAKTAAISARGNLPFSANKRKSECESGNNPDKVPKIVLDKEMLLEVSQEIFQQFIPQMQVLIDNAFSKIDKKIDEVQARVANLHLGQVNLEERVNSLENVPANINLDEIKEAIMPELSANISSSTNSQWKLHLITEIEKSDRCLILKGLKPQEALNKHCFYDLCKNDLRMTADDLSRIEIVSMSATKGPKSNPIVFVTLGSVAQRNMCFKYCKNLPKQISFDKHVPRNYLAKYQEFKHLAWKLRVASNVQTRIDFEGPNLTLRYKNKDSEDSIYSWVIHSEFMPKPELPPSKPLYTPASGSIPTPLIPSSTLEKIGIMSNIGQPEAGANIAESLKSHFADSDLSNITNIEMRNPSTAVFTFVSIEHASSITVKYNGKVFLGGRKVHFKIF